MAVPTSFGSISLNSDGYNYPIPAGYKATIIMRAFCTWTPTYQNAQYIRIWGNNLNVNLNITEISSASDSKAIICYRIEDAFKAIFKLITSEENSFYSEFYSTGEGANDVITSGWNLREYPNRAMTISLKDLFQSCFALRNVGLGYDPINNRFYVEELSEFYKSDIIMYDLGEVDNLIIKPFKDAYFNEINAGSEEEGGYNELQGVNEINVQSFWATDQPVKSEINMRSVFNIDTIAIEILRRKTYQNYASEDTDFDDNKFYINTDGSTAIQGGTNLSGFAGIDDYYNITFTPRNCLLRKSGLIKPQYWKEDSFKIKFTKSKKDSNITYTNIAGFTKNELEDIESIELLGERLYNPRYYEFDAVFSSEFKAELDSDPHRLLIFSYLGTNYAGFVDELQVQDYDRKVKCKLIAYEATAGMQKLFEDGTEALFENGDFHKFE